MAHWFLFLPLQLIFLAHKTIGAHGPKFGTGSTVKKITARFCCSKHGGFDLCKLKK